MSLCPLQLLYFSADHDPRIGLFKAISLLCGSEVDPNNIEVVNLLNVTVYTSTIITYRETINCQKSWSVNY